MDAYRCMMCGHIYDPAVGETKAFNNTILVNTDRMEEYEGKVMASQPIKPGTPFSALPADWRCPTCGYPKSYYQKVAPGHPDRNADNQLTKKTHYLFFK